MNGKANMLVVCKHCGEEHRIHAQFKDLLAWQQGEKIQVAMPYLDENQRELLISQTCSKCWDKMFSSEDELFI
jgi:RNase P subunit RPR2